MEFLNKLKTLQYQTKGGTHIPQNPPKFSPAALKTLPRGKETLLIDKEHKEHVIADNIVK